MRDRLLVISEIGCGPPFMGNRARMRSLLVELRQMGYRIDFAGVCFSDQEKAATLPYVDRWVASFKRNSFRSLSSRVWRVARRKLASIGIGQSPEVQDHHGTDAELDSWFLPHWDGQARRLQRKEKYGQVLVAYVFHSAFLKAFPAPCRKYLDTLDAFTERKARLEREGVADFWFTLDKEAERSGLSRADVVIAIQLNEARFFRELLGPNHEVRVVGHLVSPKFIPATSGSDDFVGYIASDNPSNICGIEWFLREVWPKVVRRVPKAKLAVGGRICRALTASSSIRLFGVLEDVVSAHAKFLFAINPVAGGTGLKIKTVEALACGRAVLGTPSAAEGLEMYVGKGLVIAQNADEFAQRAVDLLEHPKEAQALGIEAVKAMEDFNEWSRRELKAAFKPKWGD